MPRLSGIEETLLGISLTCSEVDGCDTAGANCTCRDFVKQSNISENIMLACKIEDVKVIRTKKGKKPGQKMAFLTVSDHSGLLDSVVIFPKQYKTLSELLIKDNKVILNGKRGKEKDSLIVNAVIQI